MAVRLALDGSRRLDQSSKSLLLPLKSVSSSRPPTAPANLLTPTSATASASLLTDLIDCQQQQLPSGQSFGLPSSSRPTATATATTNSSPSSTATTTTDNPATAQQLADHDNRPPAHPAATPVTVTAAAPRTRKIRPYRAGHGGRRSTSSTAPSDRSPTPKIRPPSTTVQDHLRAVRPGLFQDQLGPHRHPVSRSFKTAPDPPSQDHLAGASRLASSSSGAVTNHRD